MRVMDRKAEYRWPHRVLWRLANRAAVIGFAFGYLADWLRDVADWSEHGGKVGTTWRRR